MSSLKRVQQWATFARAWHLYDATWQDPMVFSPTVADVLSGKNKPIFHPSNDCGDHVVIVNAAKIALFCDNWRYCHLYVDTRFPRQKYKIPYFHVHDTDPCKLTERYVTRAFGRDLKGMWRKRIRKGRLHIYPDENVPEDILKNISHQIRQHKLVPKTLEDYSIEEIEAFPKVLDLPDDFVEYDLAAFDRPFVDPSARIPRPPGKESRPKLPDANLSMFTKGTHRPDQIFAPDGTEVTNRHNRDKKKVGKTLYDKMKEETR